MDRDIINHPWGQSQDWTGDIKGYSPSHWLSGPPRAPYGFSGEVPEPPFSEPQMPLEGEQGSFYDAAPTPSGAASYDDIYPSTGVIYPPKSYNNHPNQNTKVMEYTQNPSQQQNNQPQQNNSENTLDWYKVLYTGSIILMGLGSIAVAVIQYKMYSEKQKQKNKPNPYHYDAYKSES